MSKTLVQEQFGKTAASYLTSAPHAKGASLERLVELTKPQKNWRGLDVATGGGHVAYTFATHVDRMWATDITQEMLDMVKAEAAKRGLTNVRTAYAKAEALPFEDGTFVKFWGIDASMTDTLAAQERQARFYAKHGINMVRQHPVESVLGSPIRDAGTLFETKYSLSLKVNMARFQGSMGSAMVTSSIGSSGTAPSSSVTSAFGATSVPGTTSDLGAVSVP